MPGVTKTAKVSNSWCQSGAYSTSEIIRLKLNPHHDGIKGKVEGFEDVSGNGKMFQARPTR